jgi:tetratricopeptide (TPR) repeat protein
MRKIIACLAFAVLVLSGAFGLDAVNYTYNYDYWNNAVSSPDAYRAVDYLEGKDFGTTDFAQPQGLFIRGSSLYICDTLNDRIVEVNANSDGSYTLQKIYDEGLNNPTDIFVTADGDIYIADMNNNRILVLDADWNYKKVITKPNDPTIDASFIFLPEKLVVDDAGRVYVQAQSVNKGLMEFDRTGVFQGYLGANRVQVNLLDYFWKMISTRAQREALQSFVPTEYNNVALDSEGFLYVTNSTGQSGPVSQRVSPVRRLNAMGDDILIRNGNSDPIGDLVYGNAGGIIGPSRFIDAAAFDDDSYACFDSNRGRVFMYDAQGDLLYAFGGIGNSKGYFQYPAALARMGSTLFALDSKTGRLTRFEITNYGSLINTALDAYQDGRYDDSAAAWEQVLKFNGNYDMAYIGIARAALRQGDYAKAMKYYEIKKNAVGYGKAFQLYRKAWVEKNLYYLLAIVLVLIILHYVKVFIRWKNGGKKLRTHKDSRLWRYLESLRYCFHTCIHPFDGFWDLTHEGRGSLAAANTITALAVLTQIVSTAATNFQFHLVNWDKFNILIIALQVLLPLLLWTVVNWSLTTLMDGKGTLPEIYMATSYALSPYVLINILLIPLSYLITKQEGMVYTFFQVLAQVWTVLLILSAMMMIHDYSASKTIGSSLLSIIGMGILIFIFIIFFSMISDGVTYFISLYKEILFRMS